MRVAADEEQIDEDQDETNQVGNDDTNMMN